MASRALRALGAIVVGLTLVARADAATWPNGDWDPSSVHWGNVTVTMPSVYFSVKVDAQGNVTQLAGSTIKVAREEGGIGCHKCSRVSALFDPIGEFFGASPEPSGHSPNLCTFSVTFTGGFPSTPPGLVSREQQAMRDVCAKRPAGSSTVVVPHPLYKSLRVSLSYGAGGNFLGSLGSDKITYPSPNISVTCEQCPPIVFQKKVVELRADDAQSFDLRTLATGGVPPLTFTATGIPTGMVQQGSLLTGRPYAGTYLATVLAQGRCATGPASASAGVSFVVKHAPIVLVSQTATPSSLPNAGGVVRLEANVTSAQLVVTSVRAKATMAGKTTVLPLSLTAGTNKNGTWTTNWTVLANPSTNWLEYGIVFEATDGDGRTTMITGNNMITVKVGPAPSKPPAGKPTSGPTTPPIPGKPPSAPNLPKLPS